MWDLRTKFWVSLLLEYHGVDGASKQRISFKVNGIGSRIIYDERGEKPTHINLRVSMKMLMSGS